MITTNLDNVRIVLVETSHPGNIGAAARAMKTMGLSRLTLVNPARHPTQEATARASGAVGLLEQATVVDDLPSALTECRLVLGASARRRGIASPEIDPRTAAQEILSVAASRSVALVFGRERTGLSNDELGLCHYLVRIPANPEFSSLNLAAAVQVLCYELRMAASLAEDRPPPDAESLPAPAEELERFYQHLQSALLASGFLNPDNPRHLMRRLRKLFNRAQPDQREVNILRGILTSLQRERDND